jgi:DNA repair protein RecO (recombination protein O)
MSGLLIVTSAYALKVLAHEGWRPELDACVVCGDDAPTWFSSTAGGAICESCVRDVAGAVPLAEGELAWLRALLGSRFDALVAAQADERLARRIAGIAHEWAETQLDCHLRAFEFLRGL